MPKDFHNRLAANWRLIFAIADRCNVGERARRAAEVLSIRDDDQSLALELLTDMRAVFETVGADKIIRDRVLSELKALEDRPWAALGGRGKTEPKPITASAFNSILKRFHIKIKPVDFDGVTHRGVEIKEFQAAWDRYLAPPSENRCNGVIFAENRQKKRNFEEEEIA
jgi:hypothetical protein